MRTDKELLELAARAAGIDVGTEDFCDPIDRKYSNGLGLWVQPGYWFNPLYSKGDALGLAVILRLSIIHSTSGVVMVMSHDAAISVQETANESRWPSAANCATCRAIVRAAAEIGAQVAEPAHNEIGDGNG